LDAGQNCMLRINVLTTATPRPELHEVTLKPTLDVLSKHFNVRWHVTVDDVLTDQPLALYEDTMKYLKTLSTGKTYLYPVDFKSFKLVAKKLYESISPEEDDLFMWLEDDWILQEDKIDDFITAIKKFPGSDYDFIVTTIYKYIGGNPLVFRKKFFDPMQKYYLDTKKPIDPELALWQIHSKMFGGRHKSNCQFLRDTFIDAGRDWREERGIEKAHKKSHSDKTWKY